MTRQPILARAGTTLGLAAAIGVPLALLLRWGEKQTTVFNANQLGYHVVVTAFTGSVLSRSSQIALIAISGVIVLIGLVAAFGPLPRLAFLLCCLGMGAQIALITAEWNTVSLFNPETANSNVANVSWTWASATPAAAMAVAAIGLVAWLTAFAAFGQRTCPDCAERVHRNAIECRYCGHLFPPSRGLKRCEACQRPVKSAARVCRHCHHRFGDPIAEPLASG